MAAAFALAVFPLALATRLPQISADARVELRSAGASTTADTTRLRR